MTIATGTLISVNVDGRSRELPLLYDLIPFGIDDVRDMAFRAAKAGLTMEDVNRERAESGLPPLGTLLSQGRQPLARVPAWA